MPGHLLWLLLDIALTYGPWIILLASAGYLFWDKNRALCLVRDPDTGKVWPKKARLKDNGVRVPVPGKDTKPLVRPNTRLMDEYQGLIWSRPLIDVCARSGNQIGTTTLRDQPEDLEDVYHLMRATQDLTEEQRQAGDPPLIVLAERANPMDLGDAMDKGHARHLDQNPKSMWLHILLGAFAGAFTMFLLVTAL